MSTQRCKNRSRKKHSALDYYERPWRRSLQTRVKYSSSLRGLEKGELSHKGGMKAWSGLAGLRCTNAQRFPTCVETIVASLCGSGAASSAFTAFRGFQLCEFMHGYCCRGCCCVVVPVGLPVTVQFRVALVQLFHWPVFMQLILTTLSQILWRSVQCLGHEGNATTCCRHQTCSARRRLGRRVQGRD